MPAAVGAVLACILVLCIGAIVHKPLSQVPENTLKFAVGVMLTSFGVYWIGEGLGAAWPGSDFALAYIAGAFLASGLGSVALIRRSAT